MTGVDDVRDGDDDDVPDGNVDDVPDGDVDDVPDGDVDDVPDGDDDNVSTENKGGGGTRTLSTFCPPFTFFIIPRGACNVTYAL